MQQILAARIWTEFDMLCCWAQPKKYFSFFHSFHLAILCIMHIHSLHSFLSSLFFLPPSFHHFLLIISYQLRCCLWPFCCAVVCLCVCARTGTWKQIHTSLHMMQCIICNASSSSLSDAVLLVVVVGDVTKQNKHQIQLNHSISMRIPIGISLPFVLLSFLNAFYTLSGASVHGMDWLRGDGCWWLKCWIDGKDSEVMKHWKDETDLVFLHISEFLLGPSSPSEQRQPNEFHSFMYMQSHCTVCDRGQQEDRFIPVRLRTITHRLRAFHYEVITSSNQTTTATTTTTEPQRRMSKNAHEAM